MVFDNLPITRIGTDDLEGTIDTYINELPGGYRLEMIRPADHPSEAWLSNGTSAVCLTERRVDVRSKKGGVHRAAAPVIKTEWRKGRAGMEYRDLIPDRMDGKVIASHIRLTQGGPVADYVHYHKIDFQMIVCLTGRILVVYEDQGPPFWLEPGDCVLQPPQIRHRVLEAEAGSEVVEIGSPAEHETWVDHDMTLPTDIQAAERVYGGQRFVRHVAKTAKWDQQEDLVISDLGIFDATNGIAGAKVVRQLTGSFSPGMKNRDVFIYVLKGRANNGGESFAPGDCMLIGSGFPIHLHASDDFEILQVFIDFQKLRQPNL